MFACDLSAVTFLRMVQILTRTRRRIAGIYDTEAKDRLLPDQVQLQEQVVQVETLLLWLF